MPNIVSIGGGGLDPFGTHAIDRVILKLSGKTTPRTLFIPTASEDDEGYCERFETVYAEALKCPTDQLLLYRDRPSNVGIRKKIEQAEVIYVGGGNTLRMMRFWRKLGIDELLIRAAKRGVVMCGSSAGAICWLKWGNSDSRSFSGKPDWDYIRVHGLNLLDIAGCPHYHGEVREQSFEEMIRKHGDVAVALDDHAALAVNDDRWKIVTSKPNATAYRLTRVDGEVRTESLATDGAWKPWSSLVEE